MSDETTDNSARMIARWSFEGREYRAVRRASGVRMLETRTGFDAMGVERWETPSAELSEEIHEDISGLLCAAIEAVQVEERAPSSEHLRLADAATEYLEAIGQMGECRVYYLPDELSRLAQLARDGDGS